MKIKYNSDGDLPLEKTLELYNMLIVVRSVFYVDCKCYRKVFLDKCLYKLETLEYVRIDINETTDYRECFICLYWYFLKINFEFQPNVCNGCFNENDNHYYSCEFLEKHWYK